MAPKDWSLVLVRLIAQRTAEHYWPIFVSAKDAEKAGTSHEGGLSMAVVTATLPSLLFASLASFADKNAVLDR